MILNKEVRLVKSSGIFLMGSGFATLFPLLGSDRIVTSGDKVDGITLCIFGMIIIKIANYFSE